MLMYGIWMLKEATKTQTTRVVVNGKRKQKSYCQTEERRDGGLC